MEEIKKRENFAFQDQTENPIANIVNQAHNFNLDVKPNGLGTRTSKKKGKVVLALLLLGKQLNTRYLPS